MCISEVTLESGRTSAMCVALALLKRTVCLPLEKHLGGIETIGRTHIKGQP